MVSFFCIQPPIRIKYVERRQNAMNGSSAWGANCLLNQLFMRTYPYATAPSPRVIRSCSVVPVRLAATASAILIPSTPADMMPPA